MMKFYSPLIFSLFFCFTISTNISAEIMEPKGVPKIDDIIEGFRGTFANKIAELFSNYIIDIQGTQVNFSSHENVRCAKKYFAPRTSLTKITFTAHFNANKTELREIATYLPCRSEYELREEIITRGTNLESLPWETFITGDRTFRLRENENFREYRIIDVSGNKIFKLIIKRHKTGKRATFYFLDKQILQINYEHLADYAQIHYIFTGYQIKYKLGRSTWNWNYNFGSYPFDIHMYHEPAGKIIYINQKQELYSQKRFLSSFESTIIEGVVKSLNGFFTILTEGIYPNTTVAQSTGANQKLINELHLAYIQVLKNTQLNLVKIKLLELIQAAKDGLLIDKRK